jgi:hypothetical protein
MEQLPRVFKSAVNGECYRYTGNPEQTRRFEAAGIITPTNVSDIEAKVILDEVLGLARPQYNLRNMCRVIGMDNLVMSVDIGTVLAGQEKVEPMVEAEINTEAYSRTNFDLWKNVVHVALEDAAQKRAAHTLLPMHVSDAARDIARMENKQIAEVAEAGISEKVSGTAYSDWGAVTSGVSDTNPFDAITASINYIHGKGYPVDFVAMHPTVYSKFILNTWVRELVHAGLAELTLEGGSFRLPNYPKIEVITDWGLTETPTASVGPIVGSKAAPAMVLGKGPTAAEKYRNPKAGYDAYIVRDWLEPKVVLDDAADMICT